MGSLIDFALRLLSTFDYQGENLSLSIFFQYVYGTVALETNRSAGTHWKGIWFFSIDLWTFGGALV